jgi:uncharacterized protein YjcR
MPKRKAERDIARDLFLQSKGKMTPKQIADQIGVKPEQVRKWKCMDRWAELLKKPHPGAPKGNKNAAGHGAPKGNTNAETHGAYSKVRWESLSEETKAEIEGMKLAFDENALKELRRLEAKRADLERRIAEINGREDGQEDLLYLDSTMTMTMPTGQMEYINKSSAFTRIMKLEEELNKVDGRIIKLLDSIRGREAEDRRIQLERERLELAKQKAVGIFAVGEDGQLEPDLLDDEIITE